MQHTDTSLLESKLKRLKISFAKENGKIIISGAKRDYTVLLGLIFFPIFAALCAIVFLISSRTEFNDTYGRKIIILIIFLLTIGVGGIIRLLSKIRANKNTKILGYKEIILKNKETSTRFDSNSIKGFNYEIKEFSNEIYQGSLYLITTSQEKHLLLGFEGETEQFLTDDLKWFVNFFEKYLKGND